ncbi:helicase-related protein [Streptomyces bugieae]|uniref:Helicase-related protein n=1 Tax=Streptomyces bugieae TaxID=3098223 RepID=A0ABU7P1B2_9ACTN|nr:helicase-related protein [Streptomyces sp. DSM 41528]
MSGSHGAYARHREDFVKYLRRQLVGPEAGETETLVDPPDRRYLMGTLYPRGSDLHGRALESGEEEAAETAAGSGEEDSFADDPVAEANAWLPSSIGFSFFTTASEIAVTCAASRYETVREHGKRSWNRLPRLSQQVVLSAERPSENVLADHARLHTRWRRTDKGTLVTCVLTNVHHEEDADTTWDLMLFQVGLEVKTLGGFVMEYPSIRLNSGDPEEEELRVQYRHVVTRAVGHGCAVHWEDEGDRTTSIRAEIMPHAVVPNIRPDGPRDLPVLRLSHLADPSLDPNELAKELAGFVAGYRAWADEREADTKKLPFWAHAPAGRIIERIKGAADRMEAGVAVLAEDSTTGRQARQGFRLANRAMLLQMRHAEADLAGRRRRLEEVIPEVAEPSATSAWYPFQLAFFLLVVQGLVDPDHDDREIVDLIWFPTGGGKTEAYLLAACFEIILRRLRHGSAGRGTAVLSRYTLSLLTTQQFQRSATAICALEYMRRGLDQGPLPELGEDPITIGLWVGMATTPNRYGQAAEKLAELRMMNEPDDRFLLERCPWCGTEIVPKRHAPYAAYGIDADTTSFRFFCPRESCDFHDRLPVAVVDDHIYAEPPTFLLGTVDKFARLAWEREAGKIFGGPDVRRPSLVIQDELHLLSGPLGTTVGLYEAAVLELCAQDGVQPKVIASTATIRRSDQQIEGLYGRKAQLFPPAGLDARHSYFAAPDEKREGRLYLGVMAQGHTASTATVHVGAAALQAPTELKVDDELRDAYWTLVAYHNSLRELGRTVTIVRDDIPARLRHLAPNELLRRPLPEEAALELTSNIPRQAQPGLLDRLSRRCTEERSVSFLATTNMLSVGVDVPRLGLMLMNGQPKTTSEYIQATSRVGRGQVPGLVVTLLRPTKPRDRSHYETFGTYHASLYRHVEPTSVTPWSLPSRKRALHAVLTILVRHGLNLSTDDQAGEILDHMADVVAIRDRIVSRIRRADAREADTAKKELSQYIADWEQQATVARDEGRRFHYFTNSRGHTGLLRDFGKKGGLWETPQSMRNVDHDCLVAIRGV